MLWFCRLWQHPIHFYPCHNDIEQSVFLPPFSDAVSREDCYGMETVQVTPSRERLLPNPNVPAAITKGMQAVKLYSNKILHFLTGVAS